MPMCHVAILLILMANPRLDTTEFHCQMRRWSSFIFMTWMVWGFCYEEQKE